MLKIILILLNIQCFNKLNLVKKNFLNKIEKDEDIFLDELLDESISIKTSKNVYLRKSLKNLRILKIEAKSFINSCNEKMKLEELDIKVDVLKKDGYIEAEDIKIEARKIKNDLNGEIRAKKFIFVKIMI